MRAKVVSALPLVSASQISLYRECARKWAWRYISKIQTPQHPAAALGTEVDDTQLQPYLRDGRPFDFTRESGYIANAGLEFLPKPQSLGLEVQRHFILPSPASGERFAYQGYMDLWLPDSSLVPGMPGGAPFVGDFKTTSDLKWAKSEEVLSRDVQAMLYATDALFETGADAVDLAWIYFQTRGPRRTKRTHLRVTSNHAIEQFKAIERTALEMFEARATVTDPLSLPPTPSQCEAYGGCPFRSRCNLSPADHFAALSARDTGFQSQSQKGIDMSNSTSSLMANLKAKKAAAQATSPTDGPLAPSQNAHSTPAPSPPAPSEQPSLEEHIASNPRAGFLIPGALGINPPEKDLPPPTPTETPAKRGPGRPRKADAPPAAPPEQLELPFDYKKLAEAVVDALAARLGGR